jgi:hypothetical protein
MQRTAGYTPPVIYKALQFTQLHRLTQFTTIIIRTIQTNEIIIFKGLRPTYHYILI